MALTSSKDPATGPSPNHEHEVSRAVTFPNSSLSYYSWMNCKILTAVEASRMRKDRSCEM